MIRRRFSLWTLGCVAGGLIWGAGLGPLWAEVPEPSDPELRLPEGTVPGEFPLTVTGTNIRIAPSPGSTLNGNLSNSLRVEFLSSGPYAWTEPRHNEGDLALSISPTDPSDPSYFPPDTYVDNFQPFQDGTESNTALAWRVNRDAGALLATVRHNGVDNLDLVNGEPLGITHGVAYFNADLGQGWGFRMNDGIFGNGGAGSADLQMGVAGNDGGAGEASFSVSATFLPYDQGWLGAWVNSAGPDEVATFSNGSPNVSESVATWVPADGDDLLFGAIGRVDLPEVNSATDGMLFVAPTSGDNATNIAAGSPRDGGWDIAVREDNDDDQSGQTIGVDQSGYQFVYVPYDSANLVGGHVNGTDGSLIHAAGESRFSLQRQEAGQYAISVKDAAGNALTEDNGTLILSVAGFQDEAKTIPSRSFLSYAFDSASGNFVVQARQLTETENFAASANVFGDVLSRVDTDFYFAFVDFAHPFSPPGTGGGITGDFDQDGTLTAMDIDLLSAAVRSGSHPAAYDLNGDGLVNEADRLTWVEDLARTYVGDSNLDGAFDSSDFVFVFQKGEYEDGVTGNSTWASGDWNGDTEFDSSDFVAAFQRGGYEAGPRAAVSAVPEPATGALGLLGLLALVMRKRR